MSLAEKLLAWDADLKGGRGRRVAEELSGLSLTTVLRQELWQVAKTARRAGSILLGLKVLSQVIHPDKRAAQGPPSAHELAEHAALLIQLGAVRESMQMLSKIDSRQIPDVLLYKSYGHFSRWEYSHAIPLLEDYLNHPLDSYSKIVGQINLAAAYIVNHQEKCAEDILLEVMEQARQKAFTRILGNCLELRAQMDIRAERWSSAKDSLNQARDLLIGDQSLDQFFVRKWTSVVSALELREHSILGPLREEALGRGEWETLREIDLNSLKIRFDPEVFKHLFFGTPYSAYRERVMAELQTKPEGSSFTLGEGRILFDLESGEFSGAGLKAPPPLIRRVLQSLMRDLYRPVRLGRLFSELFPEDYFDVNSSPNRIHQALHRTRTWLAGHSIPIEITESSGFFRLQRGDGVAIRIPLNIVPSDSYSLRLQKLRTRFEGEAFSPKEAREILQMTPSTFKKFVAAAVQRQDVERSGASSAVYYRVA